MADKKNDDMSLENLTMIDFSPEKIRASFAKTESKRQAYRDKYGDDWEKKWLDHICGRDLGYDRDMKDINIDIYETGRLYLTGNSEFSQHVRKRFNERLREVYGDRYDELMVDRDSKDPRVAELLIQDAIKTGKWQELPDELQDEYKRRVGGQMGI